MSLVAGLRSALGHRGLGFLPEREKDQRTRDFDRLGLISTGVAPSYSLRHSVQSVLNQLGTESCVSNAITQAVTMRQFLIGEPCPLGSRLYHYFNGRAYSGDETHDLGMYLLNGFKALKLGLPNEKYWPFDPWKVNRRPPWNASRMALGTAPKLMKGYYRISSGLSRAERALAVKAALASERPVIGGWAVDRAFTKDAGPLLVDTPTGDLAGNHAMVVTDYDSNSYELLSSWGDTWRDHGFVRVTEDYLLTSLELYVLDL